MLKQRVQTAIIALAILLVVVFALPGQLAELVIGAIVLAGAWEWSALLGKDSRSNRPIFMVLIAALLVVMYVADDDVTRAVLLAALVWWLAALLWTFYYPTGVPKWVSWAAGVFVLVPLFIALVALYRMGPPTLLFVLLIVWAADIGAYFTGKKFGRVKLAPSISPGKTWEGVIGGLVLVVALTLLRSIWFESNLMALVPFCLAVAAVSIVGDLTVSMFKRNAGVKDSGTLFPGHGGILDRVDSIAAAAPMFALGVAWMGLI